MVPPRTMLPFLNAAIPEVLPALSPAIPGYCVLCWGHPTFSVLIS